jgi:hypothetical protein
MGDNPVSHRNEPGINCDGAHVSTARVPPQLRRTPTTSVATPVRTLIGRDHKVHRLTPHTCRTRTTSASDRFIHSTIHITQYHNSNNKD